VQITLNHVALPSADPEKLKNWYIDKLGLQHTALIFGLMAPFWQLCLELRFQMTIGILVFH
jgi:catechol 2,3-dioxygenase-like lactoylglutathione lyase family enzyme